MISGCMGDRPEWTKNDKPRPIETAKIPGRRERKERLSRLKEDYGRI
jgi:hypothetical protein